jgi:hypothetical protein
MVMVWLLLSSGDDLQVWTLVQTPSPIFFFGRSKALYICILKLLGILYRPLPSMCSHFPTGNDPEFPRIAGNPNITPLGITPDLIENLKNKTRQPKTSPQVITVITPSSSAVL